RVVCLPRPKLAETSLVSIFKFGSIILSKVDLPTPVWPVMTEVSFLKIDSTLGKSLISFKDTKNTLLSSFSYAALKYLFSVNCCLVAKSILVMTIYGFINSDSISATNRSSNNELKSGCVADVTIIACVILAICGLINSFFLGFISWLSPSLFLLISKYTLSHIIVIIFCFLNKFSLF